MRQKRIVLLKLLSLLIILDFICVVGVTATEYYVAVTGNDSWPGTISQPWLTIGKAASTLNAGDTCHVLAGTYSGKPTISIAGTASSPVVFIASKNVVVGGFSLSGSYIQLIGFEVVGQNIGVSGSNCQVLNNYVHGSTTKGGIDITGNNNLIKGNTVVRAVVSGIYVNGQNNIIESNEISHTMDHTPDRSFIEDADGLRFLGSGHIIRKNYIHHIMHSEAPGTDPHIDGFQTWGPATNILFEQNYYLSVDTSGSNQIAMAEDKLGPVSDLIFRNNIFIMSDTDPRWDRAYCPIMVCDDTYAGIPQNITMVNNTFIHLATFSYTGNGESAVTLRLVNNAVIKNNIFVNWGGGVGRASYISLTNCKNVDVGNNCTYNSNGTVPGTPYPGDIWMQDPKFVDFNGKNFSLQSNSPCIDTGLTLSMVADDYNGTSRPVGSGYDIGAYEYVAGALQFSAASYSVNENGTGAMITVTRYGGGIGPCGVSYAASNGTAQTGTDYTAASGTLSWADGDAANKTFTVSIIDNSVYGGNKTVNLALSNATGGAAVGSPSSAVLTIVDNEVAGSTPPVFQSLSKMIGILFFMMIGILFFILRGKIAGGGKQIII
ncbi:MAG TPA: hypothetical protein DCZ94_22480 [Lentisphaeria bacterium]|nr:MAG: hypothetical protein A2X48_13720 [Lentisphaerae bacterium GWF2_49_21]HBC89715.1 hypothetical protein [Lentisphaeria bacterium]